MIEIATLDQWEKMLPALRASGRRIWPWQHGASTPECLHVWLAAPRGAANSCKVDIEACLLP
jgi:hypothetical protein